MGRSRICMELKRFFAEYIDYENMSVTLTGNEFYHAVKVTRHKVGYNIIVCCNDKYDYYCTITEITHDALVARIYDKKENSTELPVNITLFVGVNKQLDTVIQKGVEMGVKRIIPFKSNYSNIDEINLDRLNKIAIESAKQSGRNLLPEISPLIDFNEAIRLAQDTNIFFYYEQERKNRTVDVELKNNDISVFIGSEGGFSSQEIEKVREKNANILTLGNRILRVQTAVVAALALIVEKVGEL